MEERTGGTSSQGKEEAKGAVGQGEVENEKSGEWVMEGKVELKQ